ncbi:MAG: hypothetical protein WC243_02610, partial [Patescibacteria group bacterium]
MLNKTWGITIFTLNTYSVPFGKNIIARQGSISRELSRLNIDVLNLQEVITYDSVWRLSKNLREFPYKCFEAGIIGPKSGLITFSKYPLEKVGFYGFHTRSAKRKSIFYKLLFHKGILGVKVSQFPLVVINTHLSANKNGDWSEKSPYYNMHEEQLRELSKISKEFIAENLGLIT